MTNKKIYKEYPGFYEYLEFEEAHSLSTIKLEKDSKYYKARKNIEIDENFIMYEAYFGRGMICNPYSLFAYIINNEYFKGYTHVWSISDDSSNDLMKQRYKDYDNVIFVKPESDDYYKYLSKCKYLINNVTWKPYFSKKEGQVLINTWHGVPLKKMGYDEVDGNIKTSNMVRNFLMTDYIISPSEYMTELFRNCYKLEGIFEGKIIEAGSPRNDILMKDEPGNIDCLFSEYGIPFDAEKKIVIYAPTYRGDYSNPQYDVEEIDEILNKIQNSLGDEYQVFFKPHQIVYKKMMEDEIVRANYIPASIDINTLFVKTDILVTDYSSTFFDFAVTGRKMVFFIPDYEMYRKERGVYIDIQSLPGPICTNVNSLCEVLNNIDNIEQYYDVEKYKKVREILHNDDGSACKRVVDAVFFNDTTHLKTFSGNKKKILFHTDIILKNGISSSASNLLNLIDISKYDVTFVAIGETKLVREFLDDIPDTIRVLYRSRKIVGDALDFARMHYCLDHAITQKDNDKLFPQYMYETEFKRCFGDVNFDVIINFSGFSAFYANLYHTENKAVQFIWMHNVMQSEYQRVVKGKQTFKKNLDNIYKLYPDIDYLVSCSRSTMLQNRADLADESNYSHFKYLNNTVNNNRVHNGAKNKVLIKTKTRDLLVIEEDKSGHSLVINKPDSKKINFVTMGRLADAKNHVNLIKAFRRVHLEFPNTALYIIGDGPLRNKLISLIRKMGLEEHITITGNINNPFALMSYCDCFILPSYYEGQPMVLLEARELGLAIIVSNFSTVEDSSFPKGQLIIGNTDKDIYKGMIQYIEGEVPNEFHFQADKYNEESLNYLYSMIDGEKNQP